MSVEGRAFLKLLREEVQGSIARLGNLKDAWESSTRWSEFMVGSGRTRVQMDYGVLGRIGSALGYEPQAEYFRVDQIWFSSYPKSSTEWIIEAFIEHENEIGRVLETFRKLLHVGSGLKVVVTYPEGRPVDKVISDASKLIEERYGTPPDTRLLLLLGTFAEPLPLWQGYEFDGIGRVIALQ